MSSRRHIPTLNYIIMTIICQQVDEKSHRNGPGLNRFDGMGCMVNRDGDEDLKQNQVNSDLPV